MTLKTVRDPILPSVPSKEEIKDPDRLQRWWKGLLTIIKEHIENVYSDFNRFENLPAYANNTLALAGGLAVGDFYRTNGDPDTICVVH